MEVKTIKYLCEHVFVLFLPLVSSSHLFFVCPKYDEQKVKWEAEEKAEAWAKELESNHEGLMVVYSLKIEAIRSNGVYIMDENCKVL